MAAWVAGHDVLMMTVCVRELGGRWRWWEYSETVVSEPALWTDIAGRAQCGREISGEDDQS